jgi:branched-subunit amino acid transport protein
VRLHLFFLILGMGIVTFLPRFFPMVFLSRRVLPEKIKRGLEYFPISILSSIVFPLFFFNGEGRMEIQPHLLLSSIPVFLFAWKVKSLWGSVLLGMAIYWGLGWIF